MSIRTLEELDDQLHKDLAWRKKEITALSNLVKSAKNTKEQSALLRAGVALLYAHWEGFIKTAAEKYLLFVSDYASRHRLTYNDLASGFVAVCLHNKLKTFEETSKSTTHTELVHFFRNKMTERATIPVEGVVKVAGWNLNSEALKDIICTLGLDYTPYELKENLIDERLLGQRNNIAHGEWLSIRLPDFDELHDAVLLMIQIFKDQISNSATLAAYRIT